jgi:hypothetical protein
MHPEVTSDAPGECPICRMALEPVTRQRNLEVRTEPAEVRTPEEAARGGSYVVRPMVFTDNVRAPAWVDSPATLAAHLYLDEVATVEPGTRGTFSAAAAPSVQVEAILSADPPKPWDCCTSLVHLRIDETAPVHQGATGWLRFPPKVRHATLLPASAVLPSPDGPYVLVADRDQQTWQPRSVHLGKVFFGHALVLSGVNEGDSVAVDGLFFLDAERRLRTNVDSAR